MLLNAAIEENMFSISSEIVAYMLFSIVVLVREGLVFLVNLSSSRERTFTVSEERTISGSCFLALKIYSEP